MGQDLRYLAGEDSFEYRLSEPDWHLIQSLREHLPAEAELLFIVPELGAEIQIPTVALRAAADRVSTFFSENGHLLPYTYQFKPERSGDPRITPGFSTGGMSGLRLPGDSKHYYFIRAGLNECSLEKRGIGADGRGYTADVRDLRSERRLLTENLGMITIRRTRAKSELRKAVEEIRRFLEKTTVEEVVKSVG